MNILGRLITKLFPPRCEWHEGEDGHWSTDCGQQVEIGIAPKTCPYCGKKVRPHYALIREW